MNPLIVRPGIFNCSSLWTTRWCRWILTCLVFFQYPKKHLKYLFTIKTEESQVIINSGSWKQVFPRNSIIFLLILEVAQSYGSMSSLLTKMFTSHRATPLQSPGATRWHLRAAVAPPC